ncbi:Activin types I and II receptor domain family protein [Acanthocheilonema viteae]
MLVRIFLIALTVSTVNSLQCIFGGHGVVNEKSGSIRETNVTCQSQTKFCLKLESDTKKNGEHVKGFVRGCDQEMPTLSKHEFCKVEGCMIKRDSNGITEICCCTGDYCNGGTRTTFMFTMCFINLFFLSFF